MPALFGSVRALAMCGLVALGACDSEPVPAVHLSVGTRPEDHRSFQPKSSLAEYTEIPGFGAELRVVLSSHAITCDSYLPLSDDQILVTLNFTQPKPGTTLSAGAYPWAGTKPSDSSGSSEAAPAEAPITEAQVMPHIRFGKQGRELPPGGLVELTEVRLDAQGTVRGQLRLEQPGAAGLPATSLLGGFSARWCRISLVSGSNSP